MLTEADFYQTPKALAEYLLFHYGDETQEWLAGPVPEQALGFARRCAELALLHPLRTGRALDLGCAVGRSACELSAHFEETIGIDYSSTLIAAAQRIAQYGSIDVKIVEEGEIMRPVTLERPAITRPDRLRFQTGNAMELDPKLGSFDFVLLANLIDRLPDPRLCLERIGALLSTRGILAITSPYTWLESYTPRSKWLGGRLREGQPQRSLDALREILALEFQELELLEMPFLIREHARKSQYSIAQASLWRKR